MLPPGTARMYGQSAPVEDMSGMWRTSSTLYLCASCLELESNVHKDFTITDGHLNTVSRLEIGMLVVKDHTQGAALRIFTKVQRFVDNSTRPSSGEPRGV